MPILHKVKPLRCYFPRLPSSSSAYGHEGIASFFYSASSSDYLAAAVSASAYLNSILSGLHQIQYPSLQFLQKSHALVITTGNGDNPFVCAKLISLYASLHAPHSSTKLFHSLHRKDTFLWNSVIKSHFSNGNYLEAFRFFTLMRLSGTLPDQFTIPMVVATCAELLWLHQGKLVHGLVTRCGLFGGNSAIASSFLYMYAKCGCMDDVSLMFDEIPVRDVVSWTALIVGYIQNRESEKGLEILCEMHRVGGDGERPNFRTLEGGFQACGNLGASGEGSCLHCLAVKTGLEHSQVVKSSLLSMYSKCGNVQAAYHSFCEVKDKDLFSWTSVISVHARFGLFIECLNLFWTMQDSGVHPDEIVVCCMFLGFGNSMRVSEGKAFHGLIIRRNYAMDRMVYNAVLSMYCKFGLLGPAEDLFFMGSEQNKESWNIMVSGYAKMGLPEKCIYLFRKMQSLCMEADSSSFVSVISSCSQLGVSWLCRSLHCHIIKNSMAEDISISNSLIDMYGKGGNLRLAWTIFWRTKKDIVTWNTMISLCTRNGHYVEAIDLFDEMISANWKPNPATLVTVLSACSHLPSLEKGEMVHLFIEGGGYELNVSLATALIDMYAKCGKLEKSRQLFNSMKDRDVVSWNVMISGYGMHGDAKAAIEVFQQMEQSDVKPNTLTFLSLLSACAHAGLVPEGKYLFDRIQCHSLEPNLKHYACMVDLLGRFGDLQEAEELVLSMPICPDGGVWGALLSACKIHNQIEVGIRIAKRAIESDPQNDGYYIILSNMYDSIGLWEEAERAREMMMARGVEKRAGWSIV